MAQYLALIQNQAELEEFEALYHEIKFPNRFSNFRDEIRNFAAEKGRLDVLRWMFSLGLKMNKIVSETATIHDHHNILIWLHDQNQDLSENIPFLALKHDRYSIFEWYRETIGFSPRSQVDCLEFVLETQNVELIDVLQSHDPQLYVEAAVHERYRVIDFLVLHGCVKNSEALIQAALQNKTQMVKYLLRRRWPGTEEALQKMTQLRCPQENKKTRSWITGKSQSQLSRNDVLIRTSSIELRTARKEKRSQTQIFTPIRNDEAYYEIFGMLTLHQMASQEKDLFRKRYP